MRIVRLCAAMLLIGMSAARAADAPPTVAELQSQIAGLNAEIAELQRQRNDASDSRALLLGQSAYQAEQMKAAAEKVDKVTVPALRH